MDTALSIIVFASAAWVVTKVVSLAAQRRRQAPYPPGPPPKPFIGNMLDFPLVNAAKEYVQWGKKYNSDILYGNALGKHILILNKREDADELFERRARKYSDRPDMPITKLMGWYYNTGLLRYGDEWRWHRKIYHQHFRSEVIYRFHPVQLKKVHQLLKGLIDTPEEFEEHNKMLSVSIPMTTMYGYEVKTVDDPAILAADKSFIYGLRLLLPGASLINIFPFLAHVPAWFPGASSRKKAAEVLGYTEEMMKIPTDFVKKSMMEGTAVPSLVADFLEKKTNVGATEEEEKVIKSVAYTAYAGASDTTMSATATFFYLMLVHPDVQNKAHAELDSVIGSTRLPNFGDRTSLPYIEAIYREVMRWNPVGPLGVPHGLSEDDYYKGYFIPKGTTAFGNIWAMTHDEEAYPDSFAFKPERFIDADGKLNDDSRILAYGFGRRVCGGQYIASATIWLAIVSVLACFNIEKAKDEFGNEIEVNHEYEEFGFLSRKKPWKCSFKPRSPTTEQLISEALN